MRIILLLFLFLSPLGAQELYKSDGLGFQGSPVESLEDSQWVLALQNEERTSSRTLYKEQKEYKRWENTGINSNGQILDSEKYYYKGSLRTETISNLNDRIQEEILYDSTGTFLIHKYFFYDNSGQLIRIENRNEEGDILMGNTIEYRLNGSLRNLESDTGDSIEWRSGDFNRQYIDTLYLKENNMTTLYKYESGLLIRQLIKTDESDIEESVYTYSDAGVLIENVIYNIPNKTRTVLRYNDDGRILINNIYKNELLEFSEQNTYSNGNLTKTQQRSNGLILVREYEYKSGQSEPYLTNHYRNGVLFKIVEMTDDTTWETLYRNNEEIIKRLVSES
jgi:antitoxin component YwqK of YwqJK toxin-antitoxin module